MLVTIYIANTFSRPYRINRIVYMLVHVNIVKTTFHSMRLGRRKIRKLFKRHIPRTFRYNFPMRQVFIQTQRTTTRHINQNPLGRSTHQQTIISTANFEITGGTQHIVRRRPRDKRQLFAFAWDFQNIHQVMRNHPRHIMFQQVCTPTSQAFCVRIGNAL